MNWYPRPKYPNSNQYSPGARLQAEALALRATESKTTKTTKRTKKKHTHKWVMGLFLSHLWMDADRSDWEGYYDKAIWICECGERKVSIYREEDK